MFKQQITGFIFFTLFFLALDTYVWQGIKTITPQWSQRAKSILKYSYWGYTVFTFVFFLLVRFQFLPLPTSMVKIMSAIAFAVVIAKLIWVIFLLLDDIIRLGRWIQQYFFSDVETAPDRPSGISRLKFLQYTGLVVGAAFVGTAIWGIFKGAHNYTIHRKKIKLVGLPNAFKGLKILQISDIHSGSFWDREAVAEGIKLINEQQADVVFFTGDIVNNRSEELLPWMDLFAQIKAPMGVFSTLGNHDYGDYVPWPSAAAKKKNLEDLISYHKQMGWDILNDEHRVLEKDGQKLTIVGVQNWSAKARFPKYGNLEKALEGAPKDILKLLLSHDPSHWREEVVGKQTDIALTFAGHTHGMQFGIDSKFYRWSPVKYVYKEWLDLYTVKDQHLYVNRGFGYLGYPGRMGIYPEITVITLA
ncbi:MAG: metallophosphoesterase [Bacteroidetes bacterium]|nr:metallophosphoesterase [Bacteroidota bacterium]